MKLTVIGCSHTYYVWPTWADILSQEYDEYDNWGSSGIGNYAIFHRCIEIVEQYKPGDKVIVQWTYPNRFDFHKFGEGWYQGGNLANLHDHIQQVVAAVAFDEQSYNWQTNNFITAIETMFEANNVDYQMIAPDYSVGTLPPLHIMDTFGIPKRRFINVRPNQMFKDDDHHWTPKHHLKYLESAGFTITQKMLQYIEQVEKELDDISNWKQVNYRMQEKGYIRAHVLGR